MYLLTIWLPLVSEFAVTNPAIVFRPMPGHNPRSRQDRYRRVHYYVSQLGAAASGHLKQALLALRGASDHMPEDLQNLAMKPYMESEFLPATKELLCIWIHLEAVDQGGEGMPSWLMQYLKLGLYATDYLIPEPQAINVMQAHAPCTELPALFDEVALTMAQYLGYGARASEFAPAFNPLLESTRQLRQKILKQSLTADLETLP